MTDKPISQMTKKEMNDFLTKHFGSLRKAKKQLETFESEVKKLKTDARKEIKDETDLIKKHIKSEKKVVSDKTQNTRTFAVNKQRLIEKELTNTKDYTKKTKKLTDEQLKEINILLAKIKKYHDDLLTDKKDREGNIVPSIKTKMVEYIKDQRGDFNQLRKDLKKEIHDLLPEAGAAGLASAYFEAKTRYGAVPYKNPTDEEKVDEKNADKKTDDEKNSDETTFSRPNAFWHFIGTNIKGIMFYTLFIAPLGFIVYFILFGDLKLGEFIVDEKFNYNALWNRFFISSPFATLSWFGWSSIRLNRRLYEEYNHKQRVMQLYHSFKKEVGLHGTEEQREKLLDIMLKNVGDKPSLAVHSGKEQTEQMSFFRGLFVLTKRVTKLPDPESSTGKNNSGTDKGNKK